MNKLMLIVLFSNVCFLVKAQSSESSSSSEYDSSGSGSFESECEEALEAASTALKGIFENKEELECVRDLQLTEFLNVNSTSEEEESNSEKFNEFYESLDEEGKANVKKCVIDQGNMAIENARGNITEECKQELEENMNNFLNSAESEEESY